MCKSSYCENQTGETEGGGSEPGGGGEPLTPGDSFGGFPSNPYDGQVYEYVYPGGAKTEFTFSSELNAWLLPGVQAIADKGYDFQFPPNAPPTFNGEIRSSIALPALAEPTFVGEVILAGAATVTVTLFVYEYAKYLTYSRSVDPDLEFCIARYVQCQEIGWWQDCDTCLFRCRSQGGAWPTEICPVY